MAAASVPLGYAQQWFSEKVPYVWGGITQFGADCSGFIIGIFQQSGINIAGRTSEQQAQLGAPVGSLSQAQPGDILFYNYEGTNSHEAIYAGNGMQYAETDPSGGLQYQPVDTSHLDAIRRFITGSGTPAGPGISGQVAGMTAPNADLQDIYAHFLDEGYSAIAAAGITGRIEQESQGNPEAIQPGGPGRGIAQWSLGGRWNPALMTGNVQVDLQNQLAYIDQELGSNPAYGQAALQAATTPAQAASIFTADYERGVPGNEQQYATDIYNYESSTPNATLTGINIPIAPGLNIPIPGTGGGSSGSTDVFSGIGQDLFKAFFPKGMATRIVLAILGIALLIIGVNALTKQNQSAPDIILQAPSTVSNSTQRGYAKVSGPSKGPSGMAQKMGGTAKDAAKGAAVVGGAVA